MTIIYGIYKPITPTVFSAGLVFTNQSFSITLADPIGYLTEEQAEAALTKLPVGVYTIIKIYITL